MLATELDISSAKRKIISFIKQKVEESGTDGTVLGISGGIDSAVTAYLCVEALGSRRVTGLIMPILGPPPTKTSRMRSSSRASYASRRRRSMSPPSTRRT